MKTKLAIIAACLCACLPTQVQAQENFAWITNTNGVTWKKDIDHYASLHFGNDYAARHKIAQILVPEHAIIDYIVVFDCVNLTNIVIQPAKARTYKRSEDGKPTLDVVDSEHLRIWASFSGLRYITRQKTMKVLLDYYATDFFGNPIFPRRWPIQWTELKELPKMEFRTYSTDNGKELEIVWRESNLQIAAAVNGKWKDYNGNSPLRIPLWLGAKDKQFFRIKPEEDE